MALGETIKKALLDVVIFSVSGVICVVGSFVIMKKFFPNVMVQVSAHAGDESGNKSANSSHAPAKSKSSHDGEKSGDHAGGSDKSGGHHFPLKSVIVNLTDDNVRRFAKVTLTLLISDEKAVPELQKREPQIYDTLIKIVSRYRYDEINSIEGKETLKEEVKSRLNMILKDETILDVYLTELIIQ